MSADFFAGYISGAAGIILGNPLDILKVRLQAGTTSPTPTSSSPSTPPQTILRSPNTFLLGTAAPVLGYGALNALLFVSYNRTESLLNSLLSPSSVSLEKGSNLLTAWLAGAAGGLATWAVSTPTELVKCRAQVLSSSSQGGGGSSWQITKQVLRAEGVRGLFRGGGVTALRDGVGYGFYFWGYELCSRWMGPKDGGGEAARVLLCGGLAGVITWASIFPLDVVKTRVQTQELLVVREMGERTPLVGGTDKKRLGAWEMARETYREGGVRPFFRGLMVCSVRAFIVNAVQWAVYEWIMMELGQGRKRNDVGDVGAASA